MELFTRNHGIIDHTQGFIDHSDGIIDHANGIINRSDEITVQTDGIIDDIDDSYQPFCRKISIIHSVTIDEFDGIIYYPDGTIGHTNGIIHHE